MMDILWQMKEMASRAVDGLVRAAGQAEYTLQSAVCALLTSDASEQLHLAITDDFPLIARFAVWRGAKINEYRNIGTPLARACWFNRENIALMLLEAGANPSFASADDGRTPLMSAINKHENWHLGGMLIKHGADPDQRDDHSRTALHRAAIGGCGLQAKWLLLQGAWPHLADGDRRTPLHLAAAIGHAETAEALLEHIGSRAVIGNGDVDGDTPLHLAMHAMGLPAARLLVTCGAPLNARNNLGMTPLMLASMRSKIDLMGLLLDEGADASCLSADGLTALDMASTLQARALLVNPGHFHPPARPVLAPRIRKLLANKPPVPRL